MKLSKLLHYLNENLENFPQRNILNEQDGLYEDIDEIANYPEGFSIDDLKAQPSFAAKARYLRSHNLDKLGAGSSRAVFVADNDTVIKIAKNKRGLEQNRIENSISGWKPDYPIALVKDSDPDNIWIEAERARKAKPTDFNNIVGFNMKNIMKVIRELVSINRKEPPIGYYRLDDRSLFKKISENNFVANLLELIISHNLGVGDVERISSWGVVNRNGSPHLVLVDYGLDMDLFRRLYK
jgi:hypothetical protein